MDKEIIPYSVETLISEKDIKKRITELGEDINHFYKDTKKLLVVGLLRGSFVFIADLARELKIPVEVDFMTASSYGNSMQSSNNIRILTDLNTDIKNLDVLFRSLITWLSVWPVSIISSTNNTSKFFMSVFKSVNILILLEDCIELP